MPRIFALGRFPLLVHVIALHSIKTGGLALPKSNLCFLGVRNSVAYGHGETLAEIDSLLPRIGLDSIFELTTNVSVADCSNSLMRAVLHAAFLIRLGEKVFYVYRKTRFL